MTEAHLDERRFLACCYLDAAWIDHGIKEGLTAQHFTHHHYRAQWETLVFLRTENRDTDVAGLYAHCKLEGRLSEVGGLQCITEASQAEGTSLEARHFCKVLLDSHAKREIYKLMRKGTQLLKEQSLDMAGLREIAEQVIDKTTQTAQTNRPVVDIVEEALADAKRQIEGKVDDTRHIYTGIPTFDHWAGAIQPHEYVVVGARTSFGKSSLLAQICGHNLRRGLKMAYFTLETSDTSIIQQLASQAARVNIRRLEREPMDRQRDYLSALEELKQNKRLLVFDRDLTLEQIGVRCRMLATSFKPDAVFLDYIGLIGVDAGSAYERMSRVSKAMIPLRKALGCALLVAAQINRGPEKDERQPTRSDFRDSGNLEEDAHRIIAIHRIPNQPLDATIFDCELLQLKNRDGGLTGKKCKFHSAHRFLYEETVQ